MGDVKPPKTPSREQIRGSCPSVFYEDWSSQRVTSVVRVTGGCSEARGNDENIPSPAACRRARRRTCPSSRSAPRNPWVQPRQRCHLHFKGRESLLQLSKIWPTSLHLLQSIDRSLPAGAVGFKSRGASQPTGLGLGLPSVLVEQRGKDVEWGADHGGQYWRGALLRGV